MNIEQQVVIINKIHELKGSLARIDFKSSSYAKAFITVHVTGTGYQITDVQHCVRVVSCVRFYDYNACVKVLNKIIQQAKNN